MASSTPKKTAGSNQAAEGAAFNFLPPSAGPRLITSKGCAIHTIVAPGSQRFQHKEHVVSVLLIPAPGMRVASASDRAFAFNAPAGMLIVHPADVECDVTWSQTMEHAAVAIRPDSLVELALQEFGTDSVELRILPYGTIDPKALGFAELLKAELTQQETPNELYVESLITLFGLHILRSYSAVRNPPAEAKGKLSLQKARLLREFLHENFPRRVSVAELGLVCGLPPGQFLRSFRQTFGQAPHQYILELRLGFATKLLSEGNLRIVDVAHLSGFSSQSHLTAMMKRRRNITPAELRRNRS